RRGRPAIADGVPAMRQAHFEWDPSPAPLIESRGPAQCGGPPARGLVTSGSRWREGRGRETRLQRSGRERPEPADKLTKLARMGSAARCSRAAKRSDGARSEEHTSELQSP